MLFAAALAGAEQLINNTLRYDPATRLALGKLDGKILALRVTEPALQLFVMPEENGLCLMSNWQGEVDTDISGSLMALLQLASTEPHNLKNSGVAVMGDISLLADLQALLKNLDIDWEDMLSQFTGDIIGHHSAQLIRTQFSAAKSRTASVQRLASEFITEELHSLPSKPELEDFYRQIDELRLAVDRAAARLAQLQRKHSDTP